MKTKPGRLMLSQDTSMGYFGLDPSSYAAEISSLGGPSQKTITRIMRGETKSVRAFNKERLTRAMEKFELNRIPEILGSDAPKDSNEHQDDEVAMLTKRLFYLIEKDEELYILETIGDHCKLSASASTLKNFETKIVLYNLCVFHGLEYLFYYPKDVDMLIAFCPREKNGKKSLPLRQWADQHVLASKKLYPSSRAKNHSKLATELGITKQALYRYIDTNKSEHLPRFRTMARWAENLKDSSDHPGLSEISTRSLFMARFLHSFYIDVLKSTSFSEKETLALFGFSKELRALWPSVLLR